MMVDGKWVPNTTCRTCRHRHPPELSCLEAKEKAQAKETCPCELCGRDTRMTGTRRCDGCWELETRIHADPELARRILDDMAEA